MATTTASTTPRQRISCFSSVRGHLRTTRQLGATPLLVVRCTRTSTQTNGQSSVRAETCGSAARTMGLLVGKTNTGASADPILRTRPTATLARASVVVTDRGARQTWRCGILLALLATVATSMLHTRGAFSRTECITVSVTHSGAFREKRQLLEQHLFVEQQSEYPNVCIHVFIESFRSLITTSTTRC